MPELHDSLLHEMANWWMQVDDQWMFISTLVRLSTLSHKTSS